VALDAWDDPESFRLLTEDEAATYWPDLAVDLRLARALGVPVERFAEGVEDPAEDEPAAPPEKNRQRRKRKAP
jgi:hypothetical protein